jgi:hypothetical protein
LNHIIEIENNGETHMVFCIDFDGTVVSSAWPDIGDPLPYAIECINAIQDAGGLVVISSCRCGQQEKDMIDWLHNHNVYPNAINDNLPSMIDMYDSNPKKISADVYIDDKSYPPFPGWKAFAKELGVALCQEPIRVTSSVKDVC